MMSTLKSSLILNRRSNLRSIRSLSLRSSLRLNRRLESEVEPYVEPEVESELKIESEVESEVVSNVELEVRPYAEQQVESDVESKAESGSNWRSNLTSKWRSSLKSNKLKEIITKIECMFSESCKKQLSSPYEMFLRQHQHLVLSQISYLVLLETSIETHGFSIQYKEIREPSNELQSNRVTEKLKNSQLLVIQQLQLQTMRLP